MIKVKELSIDTFDKKIIFLKLISLHTARQIYNFIIELLLKNQASYVGWPSHYKS